MDKSAVEAIVQAHLPGYIEAMGLQGLRIEVSYGRIEDAGATVLTEINYEKATIQIDPAHADHADEAGVLNSLRHELFHIIVAPFDAWEWQIDADYKRDTPEHRRARDIFIHACERTVLNLERLWRGVEAYHHRQDSANPAVNGAVKTPIEAIR